MSQCWHRSRTRKNAFTLVELLVVISVIGILTSLLIPAVNMARGSARKAACTSNLRQIGQGLLARGLSHNGELCSGAMDWHRDGVVTEVGWVADLVNNAIPVGQMLCPSNPYSVTETYVDLLTLSPNANDKCVDYVGNAAYNDPDGTRVRNPCREIVEDNLTGESRRLMLEKRVFENFYNTNYTASWFLVRSGVNIDQSGNLKAREPGCEASLRSRSSTTGPLSLRLMESVQLAANFVPLMGCGAPGPNLPASMGVSPAGEPTVVGFTQGPVRNAAMDMPEFRNGTPKEGTSGWWKVWSKLSLQDYRAFAPVHRDAGNILFADGSVRTFLDDNKDGLLNNGFEATVQNGFRDNLQELPQESVFSNYSLTNRSWKNK